MKSDVCQDVEVLHDYNGRRERPWAAFKLMNGYVALAYDEIHERKAARLRECASWLQFKKGADNMMKLHRANFCRVRLCPVCAWRRSLKTYAQVRACVNYIGSEYRYIFLTLTIKNCGGSELSDEITHIGEGFHRLMQYKEVAKVCQGFYKGLEITHNLEDNTFHPHIHAVLAVRKSYFTSRDYIKQARWCELWARACKLDYVPVVDVRKIKGSMDKAVAEVAKYAVKPSEIVCFDDWELSVETVRVLDKALENRRLTGFGGIFKDAHKALHLDDNEDGDLTHTEAEAMHDSDEENIIAYTWHTGYSQYIRK